MTHMFRTFASLALCATLATAQQQQQPSVQLNTPTQQAPAPQPGQPASTGNTVQQVGDSASQSFTLRVESNVVLTNVVVRDKKTGNVINGLKASDFTVLENNKPQKVSSFDYQAVDQAARLNENTVSGKAPTIAQILDRSMGTDPAQLRDHRLIVMFFDLSSMQDEDIDRAVDAAKEYIKNKMAPADLVAIASLSTTLSLDHDFTADKDQLIAAVSKFNGSNEGAAFADGSTSDTTVSSEDGSGFTADDTEYNNLNTDRQLYAIQSIAKSLEKVDQHKSMLYFSGGLTRQGIENQASMRAATNEAVKANMAIYSVDSRGLEALSPLGDASTGSMRGTSAYSGAAMQSRLDSNFSSQETLATLASDTGGKFFSDSNDFAPAFQQIQHDTEAYYILGFRSTDARRDGAFRHLTVKLNNHPEAKLEYRPGYYAPADFKHQKTEDREYALNEQMKSDLPAVDISMYLEAFYFRVSQNQYYVPMSLIVPGSQIPFTHSKDQDKATLDIIGQVKNAQGIAVGNVRETVKLAVDGTIGAARRNIQYSTGFTLAPGHYHVKFVTRENETGNMGSFETDLVVPDQRKQTIRLSSVVLSSQRSAAPKQPRRAGPQQPIDPLVQDGQAFVPNVPHVFRQDAHLYLLYELYDPAKATAAQAQQAATEANAKQSGLKARNAADGIRVLTSIEFLQNGAKVLETPLVAADVLNQPGRDAVGFTFDVPLAQLKPGTYICQVNVIDDNAGTFTFPRLALKIVSPPAATAQPSAAPVAPSAPAGN